MFFRLGYKPVYIETYDLITLMFEYILSLTIHNGL